ncbi:hypothetical protein V1477_014147 [Vespula maculifrons]|uniref:Uncharacterized protein n=1 Tax=Vespula maculifrons TaxID=7453 RepID=A0ABD2BK74_VESMC
MQVYSADHAIKFTYLYKFKQSAYISTTKQFNYNTSIAFKRVMLNAIIENIILINMATNCFIILLMFTTILIICNIYGLYHR